MTVGCTLGMLLCQATVGTAGIDPEPSLNQVTSRNYGWPCAIVAMMQEAVKQASTGTGDPEILRKLHEEAVKIREEVLKKYGVLDIGVPAIRELRDSE